jgi:acetoin utilization protein AcuB
MANRKITVRQYMTETPHTVGTEQTLSAAHALMRKHQVRHLPVLHGGKLVGLLSLRDLHLVETLPDVNPEQVLVEEAMSGDPFTVPPDADLALVAAQMSDQKLGSALVVEGKKVVGVLTTVDALRALADALGASR